ncbi:CynX/NimT family MFS transporter [Corynebacterium variabile]|uniref:CynX/NimT family MFS transporter n=1 Tax=Corynebacterium variabile TaxID=1727 RepID=UPI0026487B70|nr:MFS transporter [Corynebacterium variabile]MDN6240487.1 MFS transporter [Corynebacterium variabile]MDN6476706.1 MFS transporter [Corynebacterium variabile]MDN6619613.1 MFS transporter [Corynebacterium variabile]
MTADTTVPTLRRHAPTALIIAGILLVAGNLRAALTTVGPVLSDIRDDLGLSSSAASFLVSLPLLAFAVVSPFVPRVALRIGLERTIAVALGVLAVGLVVRSTPPTVLLWVGTLLIGVAIAVLNVVLPSWVKRDFPTKIGQVTGAYSAVQSGFAAVASGVAVPVAGLTGLGWRLPAAMWAGLALIAVGVLLPLMWRGSGETTEEAADAPGLVPTDTDHAVHPGPPLWRSPLAWQVAAFMGLQSTNYYVLITWLPSIEQDAGISDTTAGLHLVLFSIFGIGGSLGCSALLARLRNQQVLGACIALVLVVANLGIMLAPGATVVWACVAGIGGGSSIVFALSLFGMRARSHRTAASLSGMAQSLGYILAAVGPVAVGALHDATGSWIPPMAVLLVLSGCLVVAGLLAGRDRTVD